MLLKEVGTSFGDGDLPGTDGGGDDLLAPGGLAEGGGALGPAWGGGVREETADLTAFIPIANPNDSFHSMTKLRKPISLQPKRPTFCHF